MRAYLSCQAQQIQLSKLELTCWFITPWNQVNTQQSCIFVACIPMVMVMVKAYIRGPESRR